MGPDILPQTSKSCQRSPAEVEEEDRALTTPEYWDEHFAAASSDADASTHEWLRSYSELESLFQEILGGRDVEDPLILHLGSGDSTIPADLFSHGYHRQICVDFCTTVVNLMSERHRNLTGITWHQVDVRDMGDAIPDKTVDLAFDKSTLDAMIYGSPWNPPEDVKIGTGRYLAEVHRVLKDDGVAVFMSFRQPHFMKPLFTAGDLWNVDVRILGDSGCFEYQGYVLTKKRS